MPCVYDSTMACNCAVYVRYMDTLIFMDTCGIYNKPEAIKFYYSIKGDATIYDARCDSKSMNPSDELNNHWYDYI